ncbi:hypothetical protein K432DRAFT_55204 [Lepidopterella palustris CBS 459.81]|uniref:Uncharacterized protein n=1 Tax=Lepidopterella palustris CBS 459.81 TaxID=1314670 RepID=A0A8E2E9Q8_9PEZI|nr:hypothetical protein K432DRAFT_55204 [Lepidopterella palustris CBS 459.81]
MPRSVLRLSSGQSYSLLHSPCWRLRFAPSSYSQLKNLNNDQATSISSMAPLATISSYATPTVASSVVFSLIGSASSPTVLATVPTVHGSTVSNATFPTSPIPSSNKLGLTETPIIHLSGNNATEPPSTNTPDGQIWWSKEWVSVTAWTVLIFDATSMLLLLWMWATGMIDGCLNLLRGPPRRSTWTSWSSRHLRPRRVSINVITPSQNWTPSPSPLPNSFLYEAMSTPQDHYSAPPPRYPNTRDSMYATPYPNARPITVDVLRRLDREQDSARRHEILGEELSRLGVI